jgi:quinol monooxygenase YgiN
MISASTPDLAEFNKVIAKIGYPNASYSLWKKVGDGDGEYTHVWEGNWPDQAAYDAIHENEEYKKAVEMHRSKFEKAMEKQVYQKYLEIVTP